MPKKKRVISEAHKQAISKKLKGIPRSPEVREKIRLGNLGRVATQEQRDNQSKATKGRKPSKEWIENARLAQKKKREQ